MKEQSRGRVQLKEMLQHQETRKRKAAYPNEDRLNDYEDDAGGGSPAKGDESDQNSVNNMGLQDMNSTYQ